MRVLLQESRPISLNLDYSIPRKISFANSLDLLGEEWQFRVTACRLLS